MFCKSGACAVIAPKLYNIRLESPTMAPPPVTEKINAVMIKHGLCPADYADPWKLFGMTKYDEIALQRKVRVISLHLHPDKYVQNQYDQHDQKAAEQWLTVINSAKQALMSQGRGDNNKPRNPGVIRFSAVDERVLERLSSMLIGTEVAPVTVLVNTTPELDYGVGISIDAGLVQEEVMAWQEGKISLRTLFNTFGWNLLLITPQWQLGEDWRRRMFTELADMRSNGEKGYLHFLTVYPAYSTPIQAVKLLHWTWTDTDSKMQDFTAEHILCEGFAEVISPSEVGKYRKSGCLRITSLSTAVEDTTAPPTKTCRLATTVTNEQYGNIIIVDVDQSDAPSVSKLLLEAIKQSDTDTYHMMVDADRSPSSDRTYARSRFEIWTDSQDHGRLGSAIKKIRSQLQDYRPLIGLKILEALQGDELVLDSKNVSVLQDDEIYSRLHLALAMGPQRIIFLSRETPEGWSKVLMEHNKIAFSEKWSKVFTIFNKDGSVHTSTYRRLEAADTPDFSTNPSKRSWDSDKIFATASSKLPDLPDGHFTQWLLPSFQKAFKEQCTGTASHLQNKVDEVTVAKHVNSFGRWGRRHVTVECKDAELASHLVTALPAGLHINDYALGSFTWDFKNPHAKAKSEAVGRGYSRNALVDIPATSCFTNSRSSWFLQLLEAADQSEMEVAPASGSPETRRGGGITRKGLGTPGSAPRANKAQKGTG